MNRTSVWVRVSYQITGSQKKKKKKTEGKKNVQGQKFKKKKKKKRKKKKKKKRKETDMFMAKIFQKGKSFPGEKRDL